MDIIVKNTFTGLVPLYDEDLDNKKKLKIDEYYKVKVTKVRNIGLLRKYFALINTAWAYLSEAEDEFFHHNKEMFRETVQVAAGYSTLTYSIARKEWLEKPLSISFDHMGEFEFRELYDKVKDVIFAVYLNKISIEDFEANLQNF